MPLPYASTKPPRRLPGREGARTRELRGHRSISALNRHELTPEVPPPFHAASLSAIGLGAFDRERTHAWEIRFSRFPDSWSYFWGSGPGSDRLGPCFPASRGCPLHCLPLFRRASFGLSAPRVIRGAGNEIVDSCALPRLPCTSGPPSFAILPVLTGQTGLLALGEERNAFGRTCIPAREMDCRVSRQSR